MSHEGREVFPSTLPHGFDTLVQDGEFLRASVLARHEVKLSPAAYRPSPCTDPLVDALRANLRDGTRIMVDRFSSLDRAHHRLFGRACLSPIIVSASLDPDFELAHVLVSKLPLAEKAVELVQKLHFRELTSLSFDIFNEYSFAKSHKALAMVLMTLVTSVSKLTVDKIPDKVVHLLDLLERCCCGKMQNHYQYGPTGYTFLSPPGMGKSRFQAQHPYGLLETDWICKNLRRAAKVLDRLTRAGFSIITNAWASDSVGGPLIAIYPHDMLEHLKQANIHPAESARMTHIAKRGYKPFRFDAELWIAEYDRLHSFADVVILADNFADGYGRFLRWQTTHCFPLTTVRPDAVPERAAEDPAESSG